MSKNAVEVHNISKTFNIPKDKSNSIKGSVLSLFKKNDSEVFEALKNVSFEIKKGEFFGIAGRNGSGKSTLLKIIAQIYLPDSGKMKINGVISPFLELGVGFNPELTARENIYLNGALLGMTKKQINNQFNEIIEFSELTGFIDQKLKNFSSGMRVRLAFAVAINAHRDIILLDEVLAVGDAKFQEKCNHVFRQLKEQGKTVIYVSHSMASIKEFCDRAMLIHESEIDTIGSVDKVAHRYFEINREDVNKKGVKGTTGENRWGSGKIKIEEISLRDSKGKKRSNYKSGEDFSIQVKYKCKEPVDNSNFGFAIYRDDGTYCFDINTDLDKIDVKNYKKGDTGKITLKYKNVPLQRGTYYFKIGIFKDYIKETLDFLDRGPEFRITDETGKEHGLVRIDHEWELSK